MSCLLILIALEELFLKAQPRLVFTFCMKSNNRVAAPTFKIPSTRVISLVLTVLPTMSILVMPHGCCVHSQCGQFITWQPTDDKPLRRQTLSLPPCSRPYQLSETLAELVLHWHSLQDHRVMSTCGTKWQGGISCARRITSHQYSVRGKCVVYAYISNCTGTFCITIAAALLNIFLCHLNNALLRLRWWLLFTNSKAVWNLSPNQWGKNECISPVLFSYCPMAFLHPAPRGHSEIYMQTTWGHFC